VKRRHRALILLTLGAIVAAPAAALHPLGDHLFHSGHATIPAPLQDAAAVAVAMLIGASIVPLLSLARIFVNWLRGSTELRKISQSGSCRQTEDGIDYVLLDAPQVVFFTAGIVRPRIYATTGAAECLAPGAFRAGLLHERAHQRGRDVAWRAALAAIERAFGPFSPVREAVRSLSLDAEFAADREALAAGARKADLFDAMVAAARGITASPSGVVGLASSGTLQRLTMLADESAVQPQPKMAGLVFALAALGLLPLVVHAFFWLGAVCF
jgi:Zn-dependent protease with chaperone function